MVYHSIDLNNALYNVNPRQFCRQMDYLRKHYTVLPLDEIVGFVKNGKNSLENAVAVTFDDGYANNYLHAFPYLKRHEMPATIFVTTGYVKKQMCLNNIFLEMLDWDKIIEMSKNNVTIGAHTVSHPHLRKINLDTAEKEILESRKEIEKRTGQEVKYFASPYGEVNNGIADLAKSLGFKCMFAEVKDSSRIQKAADRFILGRTEVNSRVGFLMFKVRLTTAIDWYNKLERIARKIVRRFLFT